MKNIFLLLILLANIRVYSQAPGYYPRILAREAQPFCENEIKVSDAKPGTCAQDNCHTYSFPVLVEEFDNVYDLPNKWRFDIDGIGDDDLGGTGNYSTYFGYGYYTNGQEDNAHINNNQNIIISNSQAKLIIKPSPGLYVPSKGRTYNFTSGMIQSLSRFEYGTFEASIAVPIANKLWPAYWLLGKLGNYSEIDIFEFEDGAISGSPCNTYNDHKMTIHEGSVPNKNECERGDKYPMTNIDVAHTYRLEWNKYYVSIYVNNQLKGYATKFYDKNTWNSHCHYGSASNHTDPQESYDCSSLQGLPNNWVETIFPPKPDWWKWWFPPWPNPAHYIYHPNKIRESSYFPSADRPMSLIINNTLNKVYNTPGALSAFSEESRTMTIDWVKVYQPFCCGEDKTVTTVNDFDYLSKYTGFLTGKILKVGSTVGSANFHQLQPINNGWRDIPFYFLATDEIQINSEAKFEGDLYTEMRIVANCSQSGRMMNLYDTTNGQGVANYSTDNVDEKQITKPIYESVNIDIYPVPTKDEITLVCNDNVYEKITSLTLVDINGKQVELEKSRTINISEVQAGFYQLIIVVDNKTINKKIIKL